MAVYRSFPSVTPYRGWALWYRGAPKDQDGEQNTMALILRSQNATGNTMLGVTESPLPDRQWTHVFMTYDGSSKIAGLKCYMNAVPEPLRKRADQLSETIRTDVSVNIGARNTERGATPNFFKGIIDEVRIYNRELNEAEVVQNFEAQGFRLTVDSADKLALIWGMIKSQAK
jgi:hypothetical protein